MADFSHSWKAEVFFLEVGASVGTKCKMWKTAMQSENKKHKKFCF